MIAVIPARANSQRIPGKNLKQFHGKPIIQYSIEVAQESGLFDEIIVTTDSVEIFELSIKLGATGYMRPARLGLDEIGTQEVARDVLVQTPNVDIACVIYATSPLLCVDDLKIGLDRLMTSRTKQYSYSVDQNDEGTGNYYFGKVRAFIDSVPLEGNSVLVPMAPDRIVDINTMDDFNQAERMYERLRIKHGN